MKKNTIFRGLVLGICFLAYSFSVVSQDTLTLTWQGSSNPNGNTFIIGVTAMQTYKVDWGDGTDSTYISMAVDVKSYVGYTPGSTYTLTITTATSLGRITMLLFLSDKISELDVSNCTALTMLFCNDNLLESLDLSKNPLLTDLACNNNRLQLSDLYAASQLISNPNSKFLGRQNLSPQTVNLGQTLFASQSIFGGIYTSYDTVTKNGIPASSSAYTVTNGTITFNDTGTYRVVMTNAAIVSSSTYPAGVEVDITVIQALESIRFTWQGGIDKGENMLVFAQSFSDDFTIDWGDGVVDTFKGMYFCDTLYGDPPHNYINNNNYTVTITGLTPSFHFDMVSLWRQSIYSLDLSKCPALRFLDCSDNLLDTLDVSNIAVEMLDCQGNQLKSLTLGNNTTMTDLYCYDNQLSNLDISGCPALEYFSCSNNLLDSLNLSNNTLLEMLDCSNNNISSLNLSNNTVLTFIACDTNHLLLSDLYSASQKIAVQSDKQLGYQTLPSQIVNVGDTLFQSQSVFNSIYTAYSVIKNGVPALINDYTITNGKIIFNDSGTYNVTMTNAAIISDVSFPAKVVVDIKVLPSAVTIVTDTIRFTWQASTTQKTFEIRATNGEQFIVSWGDEVDSTYIGAGAFSGVSLKHTYSIAGNYIVTVAAAANCNFITFSCKSSLTSSFDISKSPALEILICDSNLLDTLDVSKNIALRFLSCSSNSLNNLDVSKNTNLTGLYCNNNLLSSLDISKNTALTGLNCPSNNLSSLDVSNNTALTSLVCEYNQLDSLDVSKNISLNLLYCASNYISSLDVSKNIALIELRCRSNSLSSLDVRNCVALYYLDFRSNSLSNLDVSKNTKLTYFYCDNNQLSNLDVSNCTSLRSLYCDTNQLPLSDLYIASQIITAQNLKQLGYQTLLPQTVFTGDTLFQTENIFGGIYTTYSVIKNGIPAPISDYIITNGTIILNDTGTYNLTMTNAAIVSDFFHPAKVIVDIEVLKKISNDATLADLTAGSNLEPVFNSNIFEYTVCLKDAVRSIMITAIPTDSNATVIGDGQQQLSQDTNVFVITVTAEDGITTLNYTITIINGGCGEIGTDATLSNFSVLAGELEPAFNSSIFEYTVCIKGAKSITLTATPTDSNATVIGDGQQQLYVDTSIFVITVTAEDGITTQNYIVTVINNCGVDIKELQVTSNELRVYPNPTNGQLTIKNYELKENTSVEIFDIVGKCHLSLVTCNGIIDISHLANGMYFLKIDGKVVKIMKN